MGDIYYGCYTNVNVAYVDSWSQRYVIYYGCYTHLATVASNRRSQRYVIYYEYDTFYKKSFVMQESRRYGIYNGCDTSKGPKCHTDGNRLSSSELRINFNETLEYRPSSFNSVGALSRGSHIVINDNVHYISSHADGLQECLSKTKPPRIYEVALFLSKL